MMAPAPATTDTTAMGADSSKMSTDSTK
jgi:hypothetical protein